MIDELAKVLENFPGLANRTRCFTHILNLVAKCIMRQFDSPKSKKRGQTQGNDWDDLEGLFDGLDNELEDDELKDNDEDESEDQEVGEEELEEIDGLEELLNGLEGMTAEQIRELEDSVKPVRLVLTKVSQQSTET